MRHSHIIVVLLAVCLSLSGYASTHSANDDFVLEDSLEENLDRFFAANVSAGKPGVAIKVVHGGTLHYDKAFGLAQLESKAPITPSTPFYLASVGKQITSVAVMMLAEKGLLDYQDSISKFFPEAPASWNAITVHHLLVHQSGLPDFFGPLRRRINGITNSDVLKWALGNGAPDFAPGTRAQYSNTGYVLLALLAERVSGTPIELFMKNNLFTPAGMNRTYVANEEKPTIEGRATGYDSQGRRLDYTAHTVGSGGIYSTTDDLLKWSAALDANLFISAETLQMATQPHVENFYGTYGYGYGWAVSEKNGDKIALHTGGNRSFRTLLSKIPGKGITIIMLSNGGHSWLQTLHDNIVDYLYSTATDDAPDAHKGNRNSF